MTDIFDPMETAPATSDQKARPNVATAELRGFVQRIQNLEEQKAEIAEDIKSVKAEAKAKGYDSKALGVALSLLKKDAGTLAIVQVYAEALDIFG